MPTVSEAAATRPALARLLRCPLLTVDARLRRTVSTTVEVLGPSDL